MEAIVFIFGLLGLIFGSIGLIPVLGLFFCGLGLLLSLTAVILGYKYRKIESPEQPKAEKGFVLGVIGLTFSCVTVLMGIPSIAIFAGLLSNMF